MTHHLPINLDDLLRQGTIEGERVESSWDGISRACCTVCALSRTTFTTSAAGYVVIGVDAKDGVPVLPPAGIASANVDAIQKEVLNLGYSAVQPATVPFDDRYNQSATLDDLSRRLIGEFLKELELTEGRSTGVPKILRAMSNNGSPLPEFDTDDDRLSFLIRLPVHERAARAQASQVTGQVGTKLGPSRDQVELLRNMPEERSISQLMKVLGRTNRTKFRDQVLTPLVQAGLVEPTIPDKPTSSKQRYRLSAQGRAWLASHKARK